VGKGSVWKMALNYLHDIGRIKEIEACLLYICMG
jgi:hypothetical protein